MLSHEICVNGTRIQHNTNTNLQLFFNSAQQVVVPFWSHSFQTTAVARACGPDDPSVVALAVPLVVMMRLKNYPDTYNKGRRRMQTRIK
jgi:hypothetical protein